MSLLQYMKHTDLSNPDIEVKDERIVELDQIVQEVKQSEEWEEARMSILKIGIEKGEAIGRELGIKSMIEMCQECGGTRDIAIKKLQEMYALNEEEAIEKADLYWKK